MSDLDSIGDLIHDARGAESLNDSENLDFLFRIFVLDGTSNGSVANISIASDPMVDCNEDEYNPTPSNEAPSTASDEKKGAVFGDDTRASGPSFLDQAKQDPSQVLTNETNTADATFDDTAPFTIRLEEPAPFAESEPAMLALGAKSKSSPIPPYIAFQAQNHRQAGMSSASTVLGSETVWKGKLEEPDGGRQLVDESVKHAEGEHKGTTIEQLGQPQLH